MLDRPRDTSTIMFDNPIWILVWLTLGHALSGLVIDGLLNIYPSTLERRFDLESRSTGIVIGAYDLGSMLAVIPVSYFGVRFRGKFISAGLFVFAVGSALFALPHFASPAYEMATANETKSYCLNDVPCEDTEAIVENESKLWYLFLFGQILHGVGMTPPLTLAPPLLDEISTNGATFLAVYMVGNFVGVAAGYGAGGALLKIFTDFGSGHDESNPSWVGAWWIGFVFSAVSALLLSIILLLYPSNLTAKPKEQEDTKEEQLENKTKEEPIPFPRAMKKIFTNVPFMLCMGCSAMDSGALAGLSGFITKYVESQFYVSSDKAALLVGAIVIPSAALGVLAAGLISDRLKLCLPGAVKFYLLSQLVAIPISFLFLLHCPNINLCGGSEETECVAPVTECECSPYEFDPVCGGPGFKLTYFNPCYAGINQRTSNGRCETDCDVPIAGLVAAVFVFGLFTFAGLYPVVLTIIRCVEPKQIAPLGLGVETVLSRLFGTIPGPIIFGYVIDKSCSVWERLESCWGVEEDKYGQCLVYDNVTMGRYLLFTNFAFKIIAVIFMLAAFFIVRPKSQNYSL